ncbi:MAG: 2-C-methyl-D-erythritol 4-phosphate cytidylyltransferase [Burkholderiaceae bacterium]
MTVASDEHCIALVPAAGIGARFGGGHPKQYREIHARPVIVHSIQALLAAPWLSRIHVVISPDDEVWPGVHQRYEADWGGRVGVHRCGGATRRDTVLAGLHALAAECRGDPWVFVHDAARPGLPLSCLHALRAALDDEAVGALLALPVADTLKRGSSAQRPPRVSATESRADLWLAQTPQVFRLARLRQALQAAEEVTDEASAIERSGAAPVLVRGSWRNAKLTMADDLEMIALALSLPESSDV